MCFVFSDPSCQIIGNPDVQNTIFLAGHDIDIIHGCPKAINDRTKIPVFTGMTDFFCLLSSGPRGPPAGGGEVPGDPLSFCINSCFHRNDIFACHPWLDQGYCMKKDPKYILGVA